MLLLQVAINEPVVGETSRVKRKTVAIFMHQPNSDIKMADTRCVLRGLVLKVQGSNITVVSSLFTRDRNLGQHGGLSESCESWLAQKPGMYVICHELTFLIGSIVETKKLL